MADAAGPNVAPSAEAYPMYSYRSPVYSIPAALHALHLNNMANKKVPPQMHYLTTERQVNDAVTDALASIGTVGPTVGLDLEWNFGLRVGKTAVLQLATASSIFVIQLSRIRKMPVVLHKMLVDPGIYKVGVAIHQDLAKLQRDFHIEAAGALELSRVATFVDPARWQQRRTLISLRDLCTTYLHRDLDKGTTRISSWTHVPLSPEQIEYAASDAYVSLELAHALFLFGHQAGRLTTIPTFLEQMAHVKRRRPRISSSTGTLAHERAWEAWRQGHTLASLAGEKQIHLLTAATYIARALQQQPSSFVIERGSPLWHRLRDEYSQPAVRRVTIRYGLLLAKHGIFTYAELYRWVRMLQTGSST
ncbi:ribonuclease h-like protein [Malassezia pachydermatis]|uniref:3'-5' exonuclease n=1 Tax=Malassezia pachydermatis TaxID=77020 RepID=A0A0M8MU20_9BASI|nr:ribonuclease h-like protein [Malassezia pachydermatis]KOS13601.1 ribonuclease h-like protein [Malassezia pachydermatis]